MKHSGHTDAEEQKTTEAQETTILSEQKTFFQKVFSKHNAVLNITLLVCATMSFIFLICGYCEWQETVLLIIAS
jgi:hypothetical protein